MYVRNEYNSLELLCCINMSKFNELSIQMQIELQIYIWLHFNLK